MTRKYCRAVASRDAPTSLMTSHPCSENRRRDVPAASADLGERRNEGGLHLREAASNSESTCGSCFGNCSVRQVGNGNRRHPGTKQCKRRITLSKPVIPNAVRDQTHMIAQQKLPHQHHAGEGCLWFFVLWVQFLGVLTSPSEFWTRRVRSRRQDPFGPFLDQSPSGCTRGESTFRVASIQPILHRPLDNRFSVRAKSAPRD